MGICSAWVFGRKPVYINSCSCTKNLGRYRFFSGIIQGKFSLFKQPTQQQKVGNCIVFFTFSIRRDGDNDSMSEKLCTKGKRKLHSHSKQIIMDLKALPYGQSTQALLRPQVCLCLSRIPSLQLAASPFSIPALTQVFPNSSKLKSTTNLSHLLIYKSVHNCRLKLFLFVSSYDHLYEQFHERIWFETDTELTGVLMSANHSTGGEHGDRSWFGLHNWSVPLGKHNSVFDHVLMQVNRDLVKCSYGKTQQQMFNMKISIDTKFLSPRKSAWEILKANTS